MKKCPNCGGPVWFPATVDSTTSAVPVYWPVSCLRYGPMCFSGVVPVDQP